MGSILTPVLGWGLNQLLYFLASTSAGSQVIQEGYLEAAPCLEQEEGFERGPVPSTLAD